MSKNQLIKAFADVSALDAQEFEMALLVGTLIDPDMDLQAVRENFEQFIASIGEPKIRWRRSIVREVQAIWIWRNASLNS